MRVVSSKFRLAVAQEYFFVHKSRKRREYLQKLTFSRAVNHSVSSIQLESVIRVTDIPLHQPTNVQVATTEGRSLSKIALFPLKIRN